MKYTVLLYPSHEGYAVSCPALPGCWSQGETEEEALLNIQDAIQEYLAALGDMYKNDRAAQQVELFAKPV